MRINLNETDLQFQLYLDNAYLGQDCFSFEFDNYFADCEELTFRRITNDLIYFYPDFERLCYLDN